MPIIRDWELSVDVDKVLWGQGADPAAVRFRRPKLVAIAERAIVEGQGLLAPAVAYERYPVSERRHERLWLGDGSAAAIGSLAGPLIASHLSRADEVILAVCTVGNGLAELISRTFPSDPVLALALDGYASAMAEALAEAACQRFEALAQAEGLQAGTPLNPGMIGWPLDVGQEQIFSILDTFPIGVRLEEGGIMSPLKSLSLAVGLGRDMDAAGSACDFCSMSSTCRYKHHYQEIKPVAL
jgi:hypothetical protein